jgi:hypothetical protein
VSIARATEGDVWFPCESYLAESAGKREWDHFGGLESYCWAVKTTPPRLLSALREERIKAIIVRRDGLWVFGRLRAEITDEVNRHYSKQDLGTMVVYTPRSPTSAPVP